MIWVPIGHLLPGSEPVAICAEDAQIPLVQFPVLKARPPVVLPFSLKKLGARVYVVDVEAAEIIKPASLTLPAKGIEKFNLSLPISGAFAKLIIVLVPKVLLATRGAKLVFASFPTLFAFPAIAPSGREVAVSTAILSRSILQTILVGFEWLRTVAASDCYGCFLHLRNIASNKANDNFDIACKRIEDAQRQGDLFIESAA